MPAQKSRLLTILLLLFAGVSATVDSASAQANNSANAQVKLGPAKPSLVIKVGITEYQTIDQTYDKYADLFAQLASYATPNEPVSFTFAIGTYGEVLDWYNSRSIDIAILSAMPTADLLQQSQSENLSSAYLGDISVTVPKRASQVTLLNLFGKPANNPFIYRPGCIVLNSDKELQTMQDIKRLWAENKLKFLFVRPYSLSGYIAPLDVLRKYYIDPLSKPDQMQFTYQHPRSLELMIKSLSESQRSPDTHLVAFVLDDTRYDPTGIPGYNPAQPVFRKIDLPELDSYSIPREIVLANYHQQQEELEDGTNKFQKYHDVMKGLLEKWNQAKVVKPQRAHAGQPVPTGTDWRYDPNEWVPRYASIQEALKRISVPKELLYKSNFDELLDNLTRAKSPRLALVLSGGGAKCAYQAGAIIEIERMLKKKNEEFRQKGIDKKLDIDLVVGTSGGAINALLVALGITRQDSAQDQLAETWRSFRQQHFLHPSWRFSLVFGICFGLLQTLLIIAAVLLFDRETMNWAITGTVLLTIGVAELVAGFYFEFVALFVPLLLFELLGVGLLMFLFWIVDWLIHRKGIFPGLQHWRQVTVILMLIFGVLEFLIATVAWFGTVVERVSDNHWVEHLWTLVTLISVWSFPYPFLIALFVAAFGSSVRPNFWDKRREHVVLWTAVLLVFFSGVLVLQLFFKESSPSESVGIERAFVQQIPKLVRSTIDTSFAPETGPGKTELQSLSEGLLAGKLLQRDLVITTSRLPGSEDEKLLPVNPLPDDLYFYEHGDKDHTVPSPPDKRFVPLKYNQEKLLDVVIGSSTIYPIFSPRTLSSVWLGNDFSPFSEPIPEMRIIDGGFIHNIPIHAARSWGATHIIVLDASPSPQLRDPKDLWDNTMMAFGYLFKQAQATDMQSRVGTFELRPTSRCEKLNVRPICTDRDGPPEPDMDTFDFSDVAARRAFDKGREDVNSFVPLFVRFPGAPEFRTVSPTSRKAEPRGLPSP